MDLFERLHDPEFFMDAIDDAIAEIKRLRALTAWRDIAEAPKMQYLILYNGSQRLIGCFHTFNGGQWQCGGKKIVPTPTHFMLLQDAPDAQPLPEPPGPQE